MTPPISISSSPSPPPTTQPTDKKRKRPSLSTETSGLGSSSQQPSSSQGRPLTIQQMFAAQGEESKKRSRTSMSPTNTSFDLTQANIKQEKGTSSGWGTLGSSQREAIDLTDSPPPTKLPIETIEISPSPLASPSPAAPPQPRQGLKMGNKARRMVVKYLDKKSGAVAAGEAFFNKTWAELDRALDGIFQRTDLGTSTELLYRGSENICEGGKAPVLYKKLVERMESYVAGTLKDEVAQTVPSEGVIVSIVRAWDKWKEQTRKILSIFYYLERKYLFHARDPKVRRITPTALVIFRTHIVCDSRFEESFLSDVIKTYLQLRSKPASTSDSEDDRLRTCIEILRELELYDEKFQPSFLREVAKLFRKIAEEEVAKGDAAQYIALICRLLVSESEVCYKYRLENETRRHLLVELEQGMVNQQTSFLTSQANFSKLTEANDLPSLTKLYDLLSRSPTPEKYLKKPWETFIVDYGKAIILDSTRDAQMITRLLLFKLQLDEVHEVAFKKNEILGYALRDGFKVFINFRRPDDRTGSLVASLLAKHLDHLLRIGIKGLPKLYEGMDANWSKPKKFVEFGGDAEAEMELHFELSLEIFRFIASKDVFEAFYKKYLAKRLLLSKTASMDAERTMMSKLKNECGAGFTQNMESMFKDIERSKEMTVSFKESKLFNFSVDLHFDVLSSAAWPTYPEIPVHIPHELQRPLKSFEEYYTGAHKGRQISWRHGSGHAIIIARFEKGTKELVVSIHQAIVLLLFNDAPEGTPIDYPALKNATGLPDDELQRTLQSLACAHYKPLIKRPKSKEINPTDNFYFNTGFHDERQRIKINQIQAKESQEEKKDTVEKVERDRQFETQAAICRILKARKVLTEMELMEAVVEQTKGRGVLDLAEVRKNTERLIEKDYIARGDNNTIVYVV